MFFYRIDLCAAVEGVCKDSGVSRLAKSLFTSPLRRTPNIDVVPPPQSFTDDIGGGNEFLASASRSRCCTKIGLLDPRKLDCLFRSILDILVSTAIVLLLKE